MLLKPVHREVPGRASDLGRSKVVLIMVNINSSTAELTGKALLGLA
jgi:hypothetical protein